MLAQGALTIAIGVGAGLPGSAALTRFLATMLFEIAPTDPIVFCAGEMNTDPPHPGGLTAFGADATQPFIISHTSLNTYLAKNARMAQMMKPRLIGEEHAKVVAGAGGIVGGYRPAIAAHGRSNESDRSRQVRPDATPVRPAPQACSPEPVAGDAG